MSQPILLNVDAVPSSYSAVSGQPRIWLRLEGLCAFGLALAVYAGGGHSWLMFIVLFFIADATFLGYLAGPRIGAVCYNFAHTYVIPVAMGTLFYLLGMSIAIPLIWVAHIGFDRSLGYGLKYPTGFDSTHLGQLGHRSESRG